MNIRIGIDGREFLKNGYTGIGRYLSDFISWASVNAPSAAIYVFTNQFCEFRSQGKNVETITINESVTQIWDQFLFPRAAEKHNIDVLLSPYVKMPMFSNIPVVLIVNDLIPMNSSPDISGSSAVEKLYFKIAAGLSLRKASAVISISEFTKKDILMTFGGNPDRITVVPLGIRDIFKPVKDTELIQSTISNYGLKQPFILYAGKFRPTKNVSSLIRAYSLLVDKLKSGYKLVIAGSKDGEYHKLTELAEKLGLAEKIIFPGSITDDFLPPLMSAAEVFVYPSLYEGFGLPPLEAMACGTPVISSSATSLKEIIGDGACAVGNPTPENLADAISKVLFDDELRNSLSRKGLEQSSRFTVEKMSLGFLEVINNVARDRS